MCLICRSNPKALPTQAPHMVNTVLYSIFLIVSATLHYSELLYCNCCTCPNLILTKFNSGYMLPLLSHLIFLVQVIVLSTLYCKIYFKNFVGVSNYFLTEKTEFSIKNTISVLCHSKVSLIHKICTIVDDSFFPHKGDLRRQLSLTYTYSFDNCSHDYALLTTQNTLSLVLKLDYSNAVCH